MKEVWESVGEREIPSEASVEGFYKDYDKIPLSVADGIPLNCKGNDYGVVGNELLTSTAQGRSYGAEILVKWLIAKKLNLASSFTLFKSEYRNDKESEYIASAWDNRYIFNLRGTYNLPHQWSFGMKVSCIGGAPYTPYDEAKSSLVSAWDAQGKAYYDYSKYNKERLPAFCAGGCTRGQNVLSETLYAGILSRFAEHHSQQAETAGCAYEYRHHREPGSSRRCATIQDEAH